MASWDVFHADRLELERGLTPEAIRSALARGELRDDDLVRPAGSSDPLGTACRHSGTDALPLRSGQPAASSTPPPGRPDPSTRARMMWLPDFEEVQPRIEEIVPPPRPHEPTLFPISSSSDVTFPVLEAEIAPQSLRDSSPAVPHRSAAGPGTRMKRTRTRTKETRTIAIGTSFSKTRAISRSSRRTALLKTGWQGRGRTATSAPSRARARPNLSLDESQAAVRPARPVGLERTRS